MTVDRSSAPSANAPEPLPGHWRVGVFDSGLGGLSVLRELRLALPQAQLLYVADSGHAPYGERDLGHILERSKVIARFLREQGAQLLVLACNTATAAAVHELRSLYPSWPIIGVEPGLKPAAAATRNGRISIMATTATLASDKFQQLLRAHGTRDGQALHIHQQACPGLAHAIEQGDVNAPQLIELVHRYCDNIRAHGSDTVVLGCTHYPFARRHIEEALGPQVSIIDTAQAIARRAASLCKELPAAADRSATAQPKLWTTGDVDMTQRIATSWLGYAVQVHAMP